MANSINISGQWIGHFEYGPEYGDDFFGEKVQFRFFLNETDEGQFKGTSVDIEGFGANMDTATINGFLTDDFISFTKEYPAFYIIDEKGNKFREPSNQQPRLSYSGYYNSRLNIFSGQWELWANEELAGDGSIVDIFTGKWEMRKDD